MPPASATRRAVSASARKSLRRRGRLGFESPPLLRLSCSLYFTSCPKVTPFLLDGDRWNACGGGVGGGGGGALTDDDFFFDLRLHRELEKEALSCSE